MDALWATAARGRKLLRPELGQAEIDTILVETTPSIGSYVAVTVVAIVLPHVAAVGYLLIAIFLVVRSGGDRQASTPRPT